MRAGVGAEKDWVAKQRSASRLKSPRTKPTSLVNAPNWTEVGEATRRAGLRLEKNRAREVTRGFETKSRFAILPKTKREAAGSVGFSRRVPHKRSCAGGRGHRALRSSCRAEVQNFSAA